MRRLLRNGPAFVHIGHGRRTFHVAGFEVCTVKAGLCDQCLDRAIQVTAAADLRPERRQAALPKPGCVH